MKHRVLGRTGIEVSEIGYGSWAIGGNAWGPQDDADSIAAINKALDLGCTFIDTALDYGKGHSEELIGQVLKNRAQRVTLATKVPPKNRVWSPPPEQGIDDEYPRDWIIQCCEQSLRNLGVDAVDILLLHTFSRSWSHRTEWYDTMDELRKQGKIRAIGVSVNDTDVDTANVHIEAGRIDVIEVVYNAIQQLAEHELFPLAQKHNVGVISRAPLNAGLLTGKYDAQSKFAEGDWRGEWTDPGWLQQNVDMVDKVRHLANQAGLSLTEVALRFPLSNPAVSVMIPGGRSSKQVETNITAAQAYPLPTNLLEALHELWRKGEIHGVYLGSK